MSQFQLSPSPETGYIKIGNEPVLLHCHHYNVSLHETILLPEYIDGYDIIFNAAAESTIELLSGILNDANDEKKVLQTAAELFSMMGQGILDFTDVDKTGGKIVMPYSHFGYGYYDALGDIRPESFVYPKGYIAGVLSFLYEKNYEVKIIETGQKVIFRATLQKIENVPFKKNANTDIKNLLKSNREVVHAGQSNVDCTMITNTIRDNLPFANENGLIKGFGVYLTYLPSNYYNKISYGFEKILDVIGGISGLSAPLLVEAGHVCGFNTFGGMMKSEIWKEHILPNTKSKEDWIYGMFGMINALGWGHWHISEVDPGRMLKFDIYNSAEALGYRSLFGTATEGKCYMAQGASTAIMNLIYLGEIERKPVLNKDFYINLFSKEDSFSIEETKCVAKGDDHCEFKIFR